MASLFLSYVRDLVRSTTVLGRHLVPACPGSLPISELTACWNFGVLNCKMGAFLFTPLSGCPNGVRSG